MDKSDRPDSHEPPSLTIEAIDQAIQKHQASIIQLQRSRNSLIPISKLPPEILGQIFVLNRLRNGTLSDFSYTNPHLDTSRSWVNVTTICHHWREVGIACPTLWSFWGDMGNNWCDAFVSRSKAAPLHVRLSESYMPRVMTVVRTLSERNLRERVRELHVSATSNVLSTMLDHFKDTDEDSSKNPSLIRSLRLQTSYPGPLHAKPKLPETFSVRQFPHLNYLELAGCEFRLDSSIFLSSSLTQLNLRSNTTPYSLQQLTFVLSKQLQLTHLTIQFEPNTIVEVDADPVHLSFLQYIKLSGQASACFALMARVSYGNLMKHTEITVGEIDRTSVDMEPLVLQFLERSYADTESTGSNSMQPLTIRHLDLNSGPVTKKIQFWDSAEIHRPSFSITPPPRYLCINWMSYQPILELRKLCTILPLDQLHTLSLSGVTVQKDDWVDVFGRIPGLVDLELTGDHIVMPILAALRPIKKEKAKSRKKKSKRGSGAPSANLRTGENATALLPKFRQLGLNDVDFEEYDIHGKGGEDTILCQVLQDVLLERKAAGKGIHKLTLLDCRNLSEEEVEDYKTAEIAEIIEWDEEENMDDDEDEEDYRYEDSDDDEYAYGSDYYYCT